MSRIGKRVISVPKNVKINVQGTSVSVEGPKGKLKLELDPTITAKLENDHLTCSIKEGADDTAGARHGLIRTMLANMVKGCSEGFRKDLEVIGVGYRAAVKGKDLELALGYSHPVVYNIPAGITITVDGKANKISIEGADRQQVGQTAAEIRLFRKPEPYKGKGIKYSTETVRRKAGKSAATAST